MKLQHIDLAQLKPSPLNVRKHGGEEELPELIASIRISASFSRFRCGRTARATT